MGSNPGGGKNVANETFVRLNGTKHLLKFKRSFGSYLGIFLNFLYDILNLNIIIPEHLVLYLSFTKCLPLITFL